MVFSIPLLSPSPRSFEPTLPDDKLDAIRRLGFGVLNKVSLLFPTVFWDNTLDSFGHVDASGACATLTLGSCHGLALATPERLPPAFLNA